MFRFRVLLSVFRVLLCFGLAVCQAEAARAADFRVIPVQVRLAAAGPRGILTLENHSDEALRIQVTSLAWEQEVDGKMKLAPTEDVRVFPMLASVAPGEERKFRIVALAPSGAVEKAYRVFFDELPPLETASSIRREIRVLTRVGIPVFLEPVKAVNEVRLEEPSLLDGGRISISVVNPGTVHAMLQGIRVTAFDANGKPVFTERADGWYLLAGGSRRFDFRLPKESCRAARRFSVEAIVDRQTFSGRLESTAGSCRF